MAGLPVFTGSGAWEGEVTGGGDDCYYTAVYCSYTVVY